jgi:hypothetical protein
VHDTRISASANGGEEKIKSAEGVLIGTDSTNALRSFELVLKAACISTATITLNPEIFAPHTVAPLS